MGHSLPPFGLHSVYYCGLSVGSFPPFAGRRCGVLFLPQHCRCLVGIDLGSILWRNVMALSPYLPVGIPVIRTLFLLLRSNRASFCCTIEVCGVGVSQFASQPVLLTLDNKPQTVSIWLSRSLCSFLMEPTTDSTTVVIARVITVSSSLCCLARANVIAYSMLASIAVEPPLSMFLRFVRGTLAS